MPAQAGIQYAAAVERNGRGRGVLDHPLSRVMTAKSINPKSAIHHGIANRSVLPPLDMSTTAKPVAAKPRVPQSLCSVVSNLLSRVQSSLAPPQFSALSLSLMVRFSASTASAKEKICFGRPLTSGCRHLPGSIRYQPRLVTALPSSVATAAMILCGVSLHQVSPVDDGDCTASIIMVKKFGACTISGVIPRLFRNAANAPCVFGPSTPSIGAASKPAITNSRWIPASLAWSSSYSLSSAKYATRLPSSACVGLTCVNGAGVCPLRHWRAAAMIKLSGAMHSVSPPFCGIGEEP